MKKTLLLPLALLLAASLTHAQNAALGTFIDQHRDDPQVTFAYLSKDLFELVNRTDQVEAKNLQKVHQVVKNIGSLTILAADSTTTAPALYKEARSLVSSDEYDELLTVRDGSEHVHIWSKDDDASTITELILMVGEPEDFVLICFSGQLELANIADLAHLFDAAEATTLAQAADAVAIDFAISPNPSRGDFTLSNIESQDTPATLTITNQQGVQVATRKLNESATQSISLSELPAGIYWVQLTTQQGRIGVRQVQVVK